MNPCQKLAAINLQLDILITGTSMETHGYQEPKHTTSQLSPHELQFLEDPVQISSIFSNSIYLWKKQNCGKSLENQCPAPNRTV